MLKSSELYSTFFSYKQIASANASRPAFCTAPKEQPTSMIGKTKSIIDKFNNIRTTLDTKDKKITIEMINDMECPICYDEFENLEVQSCGVCCQIFHNNCINIWLSNSPNKSCPYCRSPMKSSGSYVNLE